MESVFYYDFSNADIMFSYYNKVRDNLQVLPEFNKFNNLDLLNKIEDFISLLNKKSLLKKNKEKIFYKIFNIKLTNKIELCFEKTLSTTFPNEKQLEIILDNVFNYHNVTIDLFTVSEITFILSIIKKTFTAPRTTDFPTITIFHNIFVLYAELNEEHMNIYYKLTKNITKKVA